MNNFPKILLWVIVALILMILFNSFKEQKNFIPIIEYSKFIQEVKYAQIREVSIKGIVIKGVTKNGEQFITYNPDDNGLIGDLLANKVEIISEPPEKQSLLMQIFVSWFPMLLLFGILIFLMKQAQGGGQGGPFSFVKNPATKIEADQIKITFADVAGVDEAKVEVSELIDFLSEPSKFQHLGGKIPCGILMSGAPGTGKTLLAKAIAGEAKVPFFSISGSDFVEMFVGVGASRVRNMFKQAMESAPCIIFIDEIDAVGRHRGAGVGGGHDEREQTLNQLLVEMDGFEGNEGVIVIAATNRPDVLDPALLRPGRFDRQVVVPLPDIRGREQILKIHMQKIPVANNVQPGVIARGTPGFSGADLANLVNEAALFSARHNKKIVDMEEFELAKDKIMMGTERKTMIMTEKDKKLTAYHEAGHTIVSYLVPGHDPVYKVSIIPRGRALGITMFLPETDRLSYSKQILNSKISTLFGGRIAEVLIFGTDSVTNGASQDIKYATEIARDMVTKWGLSERLGPLAYGAYGGDDNEVFLGHSVTKHKLLSDETAYIIDKEIRTIIDTNYTRAEVLLKENKEILHAMSEALLKYETLDHKQIESLMRGEEPEIPENWVDPNKLQAKVTKLEFASVGRIADLANFQF
ncbi:MAG TPA: ATP-dependent zinc metalloprotease FtsH [Thioploca sp.]|nr:ATP-dependent zinc metalloprotease FtsH [Thioploca sp.]